MKVLVTGAAGMVAQAVTNCCSSNGHEVFSFDRKSPDISVASDVERVVENVIPDVVINCAAWTDVDGCESNSERAQQANAAGPENLARASRKTGAGFITISTDYVFDGRKDGFYTQRDDPNPLSVYAQSKLDGERRSQVAYARTIVVRTGFIFGPGGNNFLSTVVDRARRGEHLKVIGDAWGTPTYAFDLAARLVELAERDLPGIFHVVNSGSGASYEDFARAALKGLGVDDAGLEVVSDASLKRPAPRPRNCRLRCLYSEAIGLRPMPSWRESLSEFIERTSRQAPQTHS